MIYTLSLHDALPISKFFAMILSTIFLDALFSVFYFVTTRYWTSNILVSLIAIGWAIANKIKLLLRGEPIYPTELSEIVKIGRASCRVSV